MRPPEPATSAPPSPVQGLVAEASARYGPVSRLLPPRLGHHWVAVAEGCVVHLSPDAAARARVRLEAGRLTWAAGAGIPTPRVLEHTDRWLVTERVPADPQGPGYLAAAIASARFLETAPHPSPQLLAGSRSWRAPRSGRVARLRRSVASPLDVRRFLVLRRAFLALPRVGLCHNDFQDDNLLYDARAGISRVIDWEYLGPAPAHTDLLSLWPHLISAEDRATLLEAVEARTPARREVGVTHAWLAIRSLADQVFSDPADGDVVTRRAAIEKASARAREAFLNARRWGL